MTVQPDGARPSVLVLGVGNELLSDEGLGIEAARRVAALGFAGIEVLDGGTLGLGMLPEIADRECLLLLDAIVADGLLPGQVVTLLGDEVPRARSLLTSVHEIGVSDALAAADLAGRAPGRVAAVGMVPESLETGFGLSALVADRMADVVEAALAVLRGWGVGLGSGPDSADVAARLTSRQLSAGLPQSADSYA